MTICITVHYHPIASLLARTPRHSKPRSSSDKHATPDQRAKTSRHRKRRPHVSSHHTSECHPKAHILRCGHIVTAIADVPCGLTCLKPVSRPTMPSELYRYRCRHCRESNDRKVLAALERLDVVLYGKDITNSVKDCPCYVPAHADPQYLDVTKPGEPCEIRFDAEMMSVHDRSLPNRIIENLYDPLPGYKFYFLYELQGQIRSSHVILLTTSIVGRLTTSGVGYGILSSVDGARTASHSERIHSSRIQNEVHTSTTTLRSARAEIKNIVAEVEHAESERLAKLKLKMIEKELRSRRCKNALSEFQLPDPIILTGVDEVVRNHSSRQEHGYVEGVEDPSLYVTNYNASKDEATITLSDRKRLWIEIWKLLGSSDDETPY